MVFMNQISRQILLLVLLLVTVFSFVITTLVAVQSYEDMKDIARRGTQSSANLYAYELESVVERTGNTLTELEKNVQITEQMQMLTQFGPLYSEEPKAITLSDSDINFYIQNQLKLANSMAYLLPSNKLKQLIIYHQDPFKQSYINHLLPAVHINNDHIIIFRYDKKFTKNPPRTYRVEINNLDSALNLFDLSSIYQYSPDYYYEKVGATEIYDYKHQVVDNEKSFEGLRSDLGLMFRKKIRIIQDVISIEVTTLMNTLMSNPTTWEEELTPSIILTAIYQPTKDSLKQAASRIGNDLAIVDNEHVWESSLSFKKNVDNHSNINDETPYIYSETPLNIASDNQYKFKIMALTSTTQLRERIIKLVIRLFLITIITDIIIGLALYLLVKKILRLPLSNLVEGVNEIQKGNLDHQVNIQVHNELSSLGDSFNQMTSTIKHQSSALIQANENLESKVKERTEDLRNTQQQLILAEKMASLGQLVAGIAHEINTPLGNSITALTFSEQEHLIIKNKFDDKALTITDFGKFLETTGESMALMHTNLNKTSQLVQTFKNVAVNQSVEELVSFSLKDHIKEVLLTLHPQLKQTAINVTLDVSPDIIIESYPGAYYHILSNMITNSLRHGLPDKTGNIYINCKIEGDFIVIHYQDDGKGMDKETRTKIFDPFFTTRRGDGGTGLGLYMTYNIVTQRLEGTIQVKSEPGKGTEFILRLPVNITPTDTQDFNHFSS